MNNKEIKAFDELTKINIELKQELEKERKKNQDLEFRLENTIADFKLRTEELNKLQNKIDKIKGEYIDHLRRLAEIKGRNGEENGALYVAIADLLELLEGTE